MDRQKEPQVNPEQIRSDLAAAKERIKGQAEGLTIKEYMKAHPYVVLGAAFLSGAVLGGSGDIKERLANAVVDIISNEVIQAKKDSK